MRLPSYNLLICSWVAIRGQHNIEVKQLNYIHFNFLKKRKRKRKRRFQPIVILTENSVRIHSIYDRGRENLVEILVCGTVSGTSRCGNVTSQDLINLVRGVANLICNYKRWKN